MEHELAYKLQLSHITKTYPGVVALDDVSISFKAGEVHALMGENGAGKSTLIKCVAGAITPDSGEIILDGKTYTKLTPSESKALGVAVIYQEFNLFPDLTVMENLFMGNFPGSSFNIDNKTMQEKTEEVFKKMGVNISPTAIIKDLSTGQKQMVEIARAILYDAKILIMDEPTASLTNSDVEILFDIISKLKEASVCIVYISHRLNEVFTITDTCTVLRDGRYVDTVKTSEVTREQLISKMVGRTITESFPGHKLEAGEVVLEAKELCAPHVDHVSLKARKGEILGLAGLVGAGRTETVRLLFGADKAESGEIYVKGQKVEFKSPADAMSKGIALCPEDRKDQGILLTLPISFNISLPNLKRVSSHSIIQKAKEIHMVKVQSDALRIKAPSLGQNVGNLSGGNQQKVVIGKWLASEADILIFDEPTRGIDVGAKQEIYQLIYTLADEGKAIIVVSSDMEEVIGLCDRVVVLCEGQVMGELHKSELTEENVLNLASGLK